MGSVLERYRKVPDNNLIAREMIIRLENMTKLSWGVEIEIENFKKYLARTDAQMRRDFLGKFFSVLKRFIVRSDFISVKTR